MLTLRQTFLLSMAVAVPAVHFTANRSEPGREIRCICPLSDRIADPETRDGETDDAQGAFAVQQLLSGATLPSVDGRRVSDRFPDVTLTDHQGRMHRFRSDLVRDHIVCVVFFYTQCQGTCPGTIQLMKQLRNELSGLYEVRDLRFISITLDPETDGTAELCRYAEDRDLLNREGLPEWYFCTGKFEDLESIRYALGLYDPDPVVDADRTQHAAVLTFGNDRYNRWAAMPSGIGLQDLKETFLRITGTSERQRFALRMLQGASLTGLPAGPSAGQMIRGEKAAVAPECCSKSTECCGRKNSDN